MAAAAAARGGADEAALEVGSFIPLTISDTVNLLAVQLEFDADRERWVRFCRHLCYHVHVQYYDEQLTIKSTCVQPE